MNPDNPSIAQGFKAGDKLAGCYTLKEILPDPGYCVVWLAHDEELGKDIALHFVPDSVAADTRARGELKQEAKRNRQLIHPRIVRVHDMVEDEKWVAISMDHVQGETLAALQKKGGKKALDPSALTAGISELCQTLEDAHRIDLFHRDLAPDNLLATANGLMVQKFGLSRVILNCLARNGKKMEGARDIIYSSPQQLDGKAASRADDIYSLGACLFALLTGTPPFAEGDIGAQIRKDVPTLTSKRRKDVGIVGEPVPPAWDETIAACLAKSPEERPKTAAEAGTRFAAGKAGAGAAAPAATAAAAAAVATAAATPEPAAPKPEPAPSGQEAAGKQQKRPWGVGPGKAPVITEATVLSNTPVPKAEAKSEGGAEPPAGKPAEPAEAGGDAGGAKKSGPTTPSGFPLGAFVGVEGEQKNPKEKSSGGLLIAAVVLVLILIVGYLVARPSGGSSNDSGETAAVPTPANLGVGASPAESAAPTAAPEASQPPEAQPAPPQPAPAVAASATPPRAEPVAEAPVAVPVTGLASMTDAQVEQLVAAKTKAVEQAKASFDDAEKASNDKAAAQAKAATALQELQGSIKQKTDSAASAKKAADAAAATLKQQQDSLQKAEADAADAQKAAAAKAQAADQLRKTVADAQAASQQQQAAQQQAEADATQAAKLISDRQQAADAATKAAADAEKARQQQAQSLAQAQADLGQVQTGIQQIQQNQAALKARKAAAEAAQLKQQREAETMRLAAQAAAAVKAAQDAQKALDAARQAVADAEKAQQAAERQAQAAQQATPSMALPAPTAVPVASPVAPAATPPPSAVASPAASVVPTLSVRGPNPHLKVDQALTNSLGMRFAPVGKVFFAIWPTRVQDFEAFATATGYKGTAWRDPGFKQAPDHPVVNVSWNDANQFCLWLTEKEHHDGILSANETYRLPTDLEWSNAVGLPTETARTPESRDMDVPDVYPWGTQWPPPAGAGNYTGEETDSDVAIKGYNDGFAWTSPVGSFSANKFGLFDMGGNVCEWCEDWWNGDQKAKVLRGSSWYNGALKLSLLSSCRIHANADEGSDNHGFRIVLAEETTKPAKRHAPVAAASGSPRRQ